MTIDQIKILEMQKEIAEQELICKQQVNDINNIPGLIVKQSVDNQETNEKFEEALRQWVNEPVTEYRFPVTTTTSNPTLGGNLSAFGQNQYYISQPTPNPNFTYYDYEQLKKTRIPSRESFKDGYDGALDYWKHVQQSKQSPTEALLDELFNSDEKLEYLLSIGYRELPNSSYLVKGEPDPEFKRTYTLEEAFLIEMKIKLKNILLSKQALKFKI